MNWESLIQSELVARVGWTLLHSLWQIFLVSVALLVVLRALRDYSANLRYAISVSALSISLLVPVYTFVQFSTQVENGPRITSSATASDLVAEKEPLSAVEVSALESRRKASGGSATSDAGLAAIVGWLDRTIRSVLPLAVFFWFVGVVFFSLRLGGGFAQLQRYTNGGSSAVDESWQQTFERLCALARIERHVGFVSSDSVQTPIAVGVLRPVIIIPASLFLQISPNELETIIVHELIHIRRFDPLVNIAQCMIEAILFYHPGVWWISGQIRREREFAADAAVIELFENSHVTYARALANLEEIRLRTNQQVPRYATAANGGNFMQRIQRILNIKTEASTANSAWTAGLAFLLTSAFLLAIFSFSSSDVVNAQQKAVGGRKLAIGFVSIPPVDRTTNPPKDSDSTARLLIQELKEHKVPAIGFLQGGMISDGEKLFPVRANIARMWIDAGFEVGLGGFKHIWLSKTPPEDYIANVEKNERVAKQLIGDMGLPPRYFSYPFLNTGKSIADKAKVEEWLASRGYTSVKYTFDNQEWMYSYAYDAARNDNDINTMREVREAYLAYMSKMFDHYEAYSQELFGRDIPQTMVLTPSRLITDTADDFFAMAKKRGYTFISVNDAQADPAYKTREDFVGDAGISWFERWSMAKGHRLRSEPEVDVQVQKLWDTRQLTSKK